MRVLGRFLLGTGERILVEASPRDRIWSGAATFSASRSRQHDPSSGHRLEARAGWGRPAAFRVHDGRVIWD